MPQHSPDDVTGLLRHRPHLVAEKQQASRVPIGAAIARDCSWQRRSEKQKPVKQKPDGLAEKPAEARTQKQQKGDQETVYPGTQKYPDRLPGSSGTTLAGDMGLIASQSTTYLVDVKTGQRHIRFRPDDLSASRADTPRGALSDNVASLGMTIQGFSQNTAYVFNVPEPSTLRLPGGGLFAPLALRRRRRNQQRAQESFGHTWEIHN